MKDWRQGWRINDRVFFCTFGLIRALLREYRVINIYKNNDGILMLETDNLYYREVGASVCGKTAEEAVIVAYAKLRELEAEERNKRHTQNADKSLSLAKN